MGRITVGRWESAGVLGTIDITGQIFLPVRIFLYGQQAPAAVSTAEPAWQAWMTARFSPVPEATAAPS